jgi:hypothetical protein
MSKVSRNGGVERLGLDGMRMTVSNSGAHSAVNASTVLTFEQQGNVVLARYRGGEIVDGI